MATEREILDVIAKIENDVTSFIAASLVDLESGMTLAAKSRRPEFDLALASAYNSEMVKQKLKAMRVLNLTTNLEDMLITLGDQIHLIKLLSPTAFLYLAADKAGTNLALIRAAVNRHAAGLSI
jgi:hypothetical protein